MEGKDLFEGFISEEQEQEYAAEAERRWGSGEEFKQSQRNWASYSPEKKKQVMQEGKVVYQDLIAAMPAGPTSAQVQACIARWHQHLRYFYEPSKELLGGLGDLYNDDPAFLANFERMQPGLAPFMREAIQHYVKQLK